MMGGDMNQNKVENKLNSTKELIETVSKQFKDPVSFFFNRNRKLQPLFVFVFRSFYQFMRQKG
jgi:hypothetical protein